MARELKFRAWFDGAWLHDYEEFGGSYLTGETIICGEWLREVPLERMNEVVIEQFTGLHDKNGKEIYEGDVVNYSVERSDYYPADRMSGAPEHKETRRWVEVERRVVTMHPEVRFGFEFVIQRQASNSEVIGTIHDANP